MAGYTPLFGSIITSSIWNEESETRIVWITMLALADANGKVEGSISGLAPVARVSLKSCEKAVERLKQPDQYSRTKEFDGRRIADIEGGWQILNFTKFREKAKRRTAEYYRSYRKKRAEGQVQPNATECNEMQPKATKAQRTHTKTQTKTHTHTNTQTETNNKRKARAKFIKPTTKEVLEYAKSIGFTSLNSQLFVDTYEARGWMIGKNKMKNWKAAIRTWKERDNDGRTQNNRDGSKTSEIERSPTSDFAFDTTSEEIEA